MKKAPIMGLMAVLIVGLVASGAFAVSEEEIVHVETEDSGLRESFVNGDYEAYLTAWENFYVNHKMSEDRFDEIIDKHQEMMEVKEEINTAMEEGYDAWIEVVESLERTPEFIEVVNEDNFETFVEMHYALQEHDFDTAKELSEELGLDEYKKPFWKGHHWMKMPWAKMKFW
jgi:hypothetical protein